MHIIIEAFFPNEHISELCNIVNISYYCSSFPPPPKSYAKHCTSCYELSSKKHYISEEKD